MKYIIVFCLIFTLSLGNSNVWAQYDIGANPKQQLKAAQKEAKEKEKHILVMIGGEWCIWCKRFDQLVKNDTAIANKLYSNYEFVHVSYTKDKPNKPFLKKYGQPQRMGFPVFLVFNAKGKLLHTQNSAYLENHNGPAGHDPKLVLEFLSHWQPGYDK